ncbi:hypothetical protein CU110_06090 [Cobetia sp. ICG0124]|nr:hypothetical protein CU110_06090 [Cobetia sp. ICG0124]
MRQRELPRIVTNQQLPDVAGRRQVQRVDLPVAALAGFGQALGTRPVEQHAGEQRAAALPAGQRLVIQMRGCRIARRRVAHQCLVHAGQHQAVEQRLQLITEAVAVFQRHRLGDQRFQRQGGGRARTQRMRRRRQGDIQIIEVGRAIATQAHGPEARFLGHGHGAPVSIVQLEIGTQRMRAARAQDHAGGSDL